MNVGLLCPDSPSFLEVFSFRFIKSLDVLFLLESRTFVDTDWISRPWKCDPAKLGLAPLDLEPLTTLVYA